MVIIAVMQVVCRFNNHLFIKCRVVILQVWCIYSIIPVTREKGDVIKMVIQIEDNVLPGRHSGIFNGVLFALCILAGDRVVVLIDNIYELSDSRFASWLEFGIIAACVFLFCLMIHHREKRTHGIMEMHVVFSDDGVEITIRKKTWSLSYADICEVRKIMIMNRFYPDKGRYRVQIKKKTGGTLNFYTSQSEYEAALDFEETKLYQFYQACLEHGIKCC